MGDKPAWLPSSAQPQPNPFMPAQPDGSATAPLQPPWQRMPGQQPASTLPQPGAGPAWLPQQASAPGSASQTPCWQPGGAPQAQQPGLPAMSPRGWPPSQHQHLGHQQQQQQQHWQGGEAQRSNPASPKPAWPPYQAQQQQQPAPMQWQGQAQPSEQSALPSPRPSWQPSAQAPQAHQQQTQQQQQPHANTAPFDPSPRASHAQQPWPPQQSTFQPPPMQSQQPSWGGQEQQYAAQENGGWPAQGEEMQVSTDPMGSTWESEQMQAANPMDNGNQGQMDWQYNEQWDGQPEQVQGMEQHGASDHDAMYANGFPDVGFDQDASVHLKDVRSHIAALKERQARVGSRLAQHAAQVAQHVRQQAPGVDAAGEMPIPGDINGLKQELFACTAAARHASRVKGLLEVTQNVENLLQECERAAAAGDLTAFLGGISKALEAQMEATQMCEALAQLPTSGIPEPVSRAATELLQREAASREALRASLRGVLRTRLAAVGWPPPLTGGAGSGFDANSDSSSQLWRGFEQADAEVMNGIIRLAAAFIGLQRSIEGSSFEAGVDPSNPGEAPVLWAIEEVAGPVTERLRAHFASGRPTDRPEKPEWLFGLALRMTRQLAPGTAPLQGSLESHGLGNVYHMPLEFSRAIRSAVQSILKEHVLPRLAGLGNTALWLHFAEEAVAFERGLSPLRGLPMPAGSDELAESTEEPWTDGSCLELLARQPAWCTGWWNAEREEALRQLDDILDAEAAWQPAPALWGSAPSDSLEEPSAEDDDDEPGMSEAWRSEFWPPAAAESSLALVSSLARKCAWLSAGVARRQFAIAVPGEVLRKLRSRLTRLAKTAEDFRQMASPDWAPRIGAYINAAHWMAHSLQEAAGPLLLLDLEDSREGRSTVLSCEAEAYAAFKQKWTLKLARAVSSAFADKTASYRRRSNFEAFASYGVETSDGEPSVRLRDGLNELAAALYTLSISLDAVVFRDTWRAVAIAAMRLLYNEIATEAQFSPEGAQQLQTDYNSLVAVFQPYTLRPAAHLRELSEACTLLNLNADQAAALAQGLAAMQQPDAITQLKSVGVSRLTPEQAQCVLDRRLDRLPAPTAMTPG